MEHLFCFFRLQAGLESLQTGFEIVLQHFVEIAVAFLHSQHFLSCRSAASEGACRLWSSALRIVAVEAKRREASCCSTLTFYKGILWSSFEPVYTAVLKQFGLFFFVCLVVFLLFCKVLCFVVCNLVCSAVCEVVGVVVAWLVNLIKMLCFH